MGEQASTPTVKRKNASLGFFSNIFKRKRDDGDPAHVVHTAGDGELSRVAGSTRTRLKDGSGGNQRPISQRVCNGKFYFFVILVSD